MFDVEFNKWMAKVENKLNKDLYEHIAILYRWFEEYGYTTDEAAYQIQNLKP